MREEPRDGAAARVTLGCVTLLLGLLAAACASPATTVSPTSGPASPPPPSATTTFAAKALNTATAIPTSIPGFEGWSVVNPQSVEIHRDNDALVMTITRRALWFMQQRGVLLYKPLSGNFEITADVHTSKSSDTGEPPGGSGSVQLAGVMARSGEGYQENYAFIVVGVDADGLSVETKNTVNGMSKFSGPSWDSGDAQLQLCRFGSTITLCKRHLGSTEPWTAAARYDRPDLPATLQAGLNIYTDGQPDIQATYSQIKIESITSATDCGR